MDYTTRNWLDKYVMRFLSMMDTISHAKKVEAEAKKIEAEAKMMIAKAQLARTSKQISEDLLDSLSRGQVG